MCNGEGAIGFRMVYRDLVLSGSLTTVFRLDRAKYEQLFKSGSVVEGGIIRQPGNREENRNPVFTEDEISLRIKTLKKISLRDLRPVDFFGSSPDVKDMQGLIYHLGLIYNQPAGSFHPETKVIKIELEYLSIRRKNHENSQRSD